MKTLKRQSPINALLHRCAKDVEDLMGFVAPAVLEGTPAFDEQTTDDWPRHPQQSPRSARMLSEACSLATMIPNWGLTVNKAGMIPPSTMYRLSIPQTLEFGVTTPELQL